VDLFWTLCEVEASDGGIIGVIVAGIIGLMKAIEYGPGYLKRRREGDPVDVPACVPPEVAEILKDIQVKVRDLYQWHNVENTHTGAKRWWVPQDLMHRLQCIEERLQAIEKVQGECCSGVAVEIQKCRDEASRLQDQLNQAHEKRMEESGRLYERVIEVMESFVSKLEDFAGRSASARHEGPPVGLYEGEEEDEEDV